MTNDEHTYAVILAGGGGTRLWPHSRRSRPKQFLPMLPGEETLIGATVRRTQSVIPLARTVVVTTAQQVPELRRCLPDLPIENIFVEPIGRNTAPCIGLAALLLHKRDPHAVLAVLPSDHFVGNEAAFSKTLADALSCAQKGHVVTIGIRPTHPETGYGYIEVGAAVSGVEAAAAFVEKPDAQTAHTYVSSGRYLWNAGMFFFPAARMLFELREKLPVLADVLDAIDQHPEQTGAQYPLAPSISIDYAVMEKLGQAQAGPDRAIRVLRGDFGWNDVGSFSALSVLHPQDPHGNHVVAQGEKPLLVDSRNNVVWVDGKRLVALVGVEGLVVAATDDVVLILPRDNTQQVKDAVTALQKEGRTPFL
ncbi:MAG TPA: sugar phosphate nucleotidyltransferase [Pseudomonadota bacterium]|nr:sugar phosphate nucleotidyltransferase [Pseudomonadota bacterium]